MIRTLFQIFIAKLLLEGSVNFISIYQMSATNKCLRKATLEQGFPNFVGYGPPFANLFFLRRPQSYVTSIFPSN